MRKIVALILAVLLVLQLAGSAMAEETVEYPRDRVGKIKIYTTATERTSWDAALHEENENEYIILMKPADIAAVAGVELSQEGYQLHFTRGCYEVEVDTGVRDAWIYLNTTNGHQFRLYQKLFSMDEMAEITDDNGVTSLYLPLEKMLYLLNVSWYVDNKTVFACPTGENMWDLAGEYADLCGAAPAYAHVVGESVGEIYGHSTKYALLSLADELDWRIFSGFAYTTSKTEAALLEMSEAASSRLQGNEADAVYGLMQNVNPDYGELLSKATAIYNVASFIQKGEQDLGIPAVVERMSKSLSEWTPAKVGTDVGTFLDTFGFINNAWNAVQTINRSRNWTQSYVEQLAYLQDLDQDAHDWGGEGRDAIAQIKTAAYSLHSEYDNEFGTTIWEGVKLGVMQSADIIMSNSGNPVFLIKNAILSTVAVGRTLVPAFDEMLRDGDYRFLAKCQFNVVSVTKKDYLDAMGDLVDNGVTAAKLQKVRLLGTLMSNGGGHCYYNLYLAEGDSLYLSKAQENCAYALRFDNASQYDARLLLSSDYGNLYSTADGAVRERIPKEYVQFPADQVIVTVNYSRVQGDGYYYTYPNIRVYIPGNEDIANAVSFGQEMTDLVAYAKSAGEGMAEHVSSSNPTELYLWLTVDEVYATPGMLALTVRQIAYYGGAHPIHGLSTYLFDLVTGEELTLQGMLNSENPEAASKLKAALAAALEEDYGSMIMGSTSTIAESIVSGSSSGSWSMDAEGFKVSFAPGSVAAYGAGYVNVTLTYSELEGIFDEDYLPTEAEPVGTPKISAASEDLIQTMGSQFGEESGWILTARERANEVTVSADGSIVVYANYLANDLVWLPEAESYELTYNGGTSETVEGAGGE